MKYRFIIHAEGEFDEETVVEKIKSIGLDIIFVEKHIDIESVIRDQNFARDENYDAKWNALYDSGLIGKDVLNRIAERMQNREKSMHQLASAIRDVGEERDVTNYTIAKTMLSILDFMNPQ